MSGFDADGRLLEPGVRGQVAVVAVRAQDVEPVVLDNLLLSGSVLSRSVLSTGILSTGILSGSVLSRSVLSTGILSRSVLNTGILNTGILSTGVLSTGVLSTGILTSAIGIPGTLIGRGVADGNDDRVGTVAAAVDRRRGGRGLADIRVVAGCRHQYHRQCSSGHSQLAACPAVSLMTCYGHGAPFGVEEREPGGPGGPADRRETRGARS